MKEAHAGRSAGSPRPGSPIPLVQALVGRLAAKPTAASGAHVNALDGLRGMALLLVFCHHLAYSYPPNFFLRAGPLLRTLRFVLLNGWMGVDVFFVLSGFLVTGVLLRSRGAENYSSVFYARRALRIAPVYYGVLVFVFLLPGLPMLHCHHVGLRHQMPWWLGLSNVVTGLHPFQLALLSPFWSLAVEEHFYLLWPLAVRRWTDRGLMRLTAALFAAEIVLRMLPPVVTLTHRFPEIIYRWTPLHCDSLLLGSLVAVALSTGHLRPGAVPWLRMGAVASAVIAAAMLHAGLRFYATPALALAAACTVAMLALQNGEGWLSRVLSNGLLRRVGRYSYCMYATQTLVLAVALVYVIPHLPVRHGAAGLLMTYAAPIAMSFVVGAVSWAAIEGPINRFRRHFVYRFAGEPPTDRIELQEPERSATTLAA